MSEKRFEFYSDEDLIGVLDTVTGRTFNSFEIVDLLNEQQAIIRRDETSIKTMMSNMKKLEEENEQLRKELNDFKPVMFQDIRGTVILYSKGGIDEWE